MCSFPPCIEPNSRTSEVPRADTPAVTTAGVSAILMTRDAAQLLYWMVICAPILVVGHPASVLHSY